MNNQENNPEFLNDFLAYSSTILNKSENSVKEYNYDINHFLKYINYVNYIIGRKRVQEWFLGIRRYMR